jgi:hypothetical protein
VLKVMGTPFRSPLLSLAVLAAAAVVAAVSARGYAGSWNDGSRLATVESLVDRHTLSIDDSIFVRPPADPAGNPYPAADAALSRDGTGDKLYIRGHFYSDKSPVPALLMAAAYQAWRWCTGCRAADLPHSFCYWMTLLSSGIAYVVAVGCVYQLGRRLDVAARLLLTAGFGGATTALPYVEHVNNHILLLGVAAATLLAATRLRDAFQLGRRSGPTIALLGGLAGLAYTIDLGAGPVLLVCLGVWLAYRGRRVGPVVAFAAAALPWVVLHHAVNYAVGGTLKPANAVPEYFQWPGCTFNAGNMTGTWHQTLGHLFVYAAALLAGKRGFLGHNLPLFLALPGAAILLKQRCREWPEILLCCCWAGGTWLAYALTSTNYSGACCSVRWFVPLLAPGYYVLAVLLRHRPDCRRDLAVLTAWGAVLAALMWWHGPWIKTMVPLFWPVQAAALLSWLAARRLSRPREAATVVEHRRAA